MTAAAIKPPFSYDEVDEYLRGRRTSRCGRHERHRQLIAALVAAPAFAHPDGFR